MYITNGYCKEQFVYYAGSIERFYENTKHFYSSYKDGSLLQDNYLIYVSNFQEAHNIYFDVIGNGEKYFRYCKDWKGSLPVYESVNGLKIIVA